MPRLPKKREPKTEARGRGFGLSSPPSSGVPMPLTATADVKAFVGLTGTTHDAVLDSIVTVVDEALGGLIGTKYDGVEVTERYSGRGLSGIVVRQPIETVGSVQEAGTALSASGYAFTAGDRMLYRVDSDGEALGWASGTRNILVTYTPPSSVPPDVEWAARNAAAHLWNQSHQSGKSRVGLESSARSAGNTSQYVQGIAGLPAVAAMLAHRRRIVS